jgi:hypothetical protein
VLLRHGQNAFQAGFGVAREGMGEFGLTVNELDDGLDVLELAIGFQNCVSMLVRKFDLRLTASFYNVVPTLFMVVIHIEEPQRLQLHTNQGSSKATW